MLTRNRLALVFCAGLGLGLLAPDMAHASSSLSELATPLEAFVNTITGPVGKWVSVIGMALVGVYYIWNRDDMAGPIKYALGTVFAICFIAFAKSMVDTLFSFSGAML